MYVTFIFFLSHTSPKQNKEGERQGREEEAMPLLEAKVHAWAVAAALLAIRHHYLNQS
jgi:hypothetical protein